MTMNKRSISWILVLLMLVTMMPGSVFATSSSTAGVSATKSIEKGDYDEKTGEATITLTASGTDTIKDSGADVIVVVDESGSMKKNVSNKKVTCGCTSWYKTSGSIFSHSKFYCHDCGAKIKDGPEEPASNWSCDNEVKTSRMIVAREATKNFAAELLSNNKNEMALVGFSSKDYSNHLTHTSTFTNSVSKLNTAINKMYYDGGTNYTDALNKAIGYAESRSDKSKPLYVVMMSDGLPGTSDGNGVDYPSWNGTNQAATLKNSYNATIYTVGIGISGTANALSRLSTMGSDGKALYSNVSDSNMDSDLENILNIIKGEITTIYAGTDATMTDVINSQYFDYVGVVDGTGITTALNSQGNTVVTWNIGTLTGTKTAKIKVRLKDAYRGTGADYKTNTDVYLTFTNAEGDPGTIIPKTQIGDPKITTSISKHDVTYSYTGNVPVGAPKVPASESIAYGLKDVAVAAAPTLEGYTFSGWTTKDVTVTSGKFTMPNKAVTFTGTWKENQKFTVNASIDNGTSPYSKKFETGTNCESLDFVPAANYHITGVTVNDVPDTNFTASGYKYAGHKLTGNVNIVVKTAIDSFKVTGIVNANGDITNKSQTVNYNENAKSMVFTADTGYHFSSILVNGKPAAGFTSGDKTFTYTATKVAGTIDVVATTAVDSYIIKGTIDNGGKIDGVVTAIATKSAIYNTKGEMKFTPAEHYHIESIKVGTDSVDLSKVAKDGTYTYSTMVKDNVNITVTTAANSKFTVNYDGNGAEKGSVSASNEVYAGENIKTAKNLFERNDYTFKAWNTKRDGKGESYTENVDFKVQGQTTLYAIWAPNVYTVNFDANGATGTAIKAEQGTAGTKFALADASTSLTKAYHSFVGWSKDQKSTTVEDSMKAGKLYEIRSTETLFAVWKINQGTVSFDLNGGKGTTPEAIITDVQTTIDLPDGSNISKDKSIFKGWSTTRDGMILPKDYVVTGDITLYAVWEQTTFDVTYYVYKEKLNPADHISHSTSNYTAQADSWKGTVEVVTGSGLDFINCTTSNKEFTALQNITFGKTTEDIIKLYKDNYSVNKGIELVEGLTIVPFRLVDCGGGNIHVDCKIIPDTAKKFSVTYEPGTQGTFEKQTSTDLIYGNSIPAFVGNISTQHNPGYKFAGWKVGETTVAAITGIVTGNATYTAQWNAINADYTVKYQYEDLKGNFVEDTQQSTTEAGITDTEVVITPAAVEGFHVANNSTLSGKVKGDGSLVLTVKYARNEYDVTGEINNGGTATPATQKVKFQATSGAITFKSAANYTIAKITVNGNEIPNFKTTKEYLYEVPNVTTNTAVVATTTIDQFTITASKSGNGKGIITSEGAVKVNAGNSVSYTITPDKDSYLDTVVIDGNPVSEQILKDIIKTGTYTFANVSEGHNIEAVFGTKTIITLTSNTSEVVYNGQQQYAGGFMGTPEGYKIQGIDAKAMATDFGTYPVRFNGIEGAYNPVVLDSGNNDVTRKFTIKTVEGNLIIKKRAIEFKADSAELPFNNAEQSVTTYQILGDGLAQEQTVSSITVEGKGTAPGEYTVTIGAVQIGGNEGNYDIKYTPGILKITPLDMSEQVKATGYEGIYDGEIHGIKLDLPQGAEPIFIDGNDNAFTNVGKHVVEYTVKKFGYNDVTGSAIVNITARPITLIAGSTSKTYDGTALTTTSYAISAGAIVTGQSIAVTVTGGQIQVGSTASAISTVVMKDSEGNDVTFNYEITKLTGVLTVNSSGGSGGSHHHNNNNNNNNTTTINDEAVPLAGTMELNKTDHFNYVKGYQDGNVKPLNNITREEVATIFYRLLTEPSRAMYFSQDENFNDIASNRWSLNSIATLANGKVLTGYENGTFGATRPITRAEFAAIASRFDSLEQTTDNQFSDVSNHWAKSYINSAAKKGWINGYEDGTFKPDQYITRAEAMTLINKVLERRVDAAGLMSGYKVFPDNKENAWYYYQVIEATNNHKYADRKNMSDMEKWTEILSDKTWNE